MKSVACLRSAVTNMASNHTIVKIENTGQLVGDPMEEKLFNFGKFTLNESHPDPEVILSFESERKHNGEVFRRF